MTYGELAVIDTMHAAWLQSSLHKLTFGIFSENIKNYLKKNQTKTGLVCSHLIVWKHFEFKRGNETVKFDKKWESLPIV